jgi:drug/metabolite transporter (DMT)-like permease
MIWALVLGYAMFGETPTPMIVIGSAIIAGAGLFVIWRERQLALTRKRDAGGELGVAATATRLRMP